LQINGFNRIRLALSGVEGIVVGKQRTASEGLGIRSGENLQGFIQCLRAVIGCDHDFFSIME
jgi:hypothetical protein